MLSPFLALPMISSPTTDACKKLGFNPTITLVIVGKEHKIVFLPTSETNNDRNGNLNFPAGTVVDTTVVSPVEFDYYLSDYAGSPGTSKPTYYNVFLDENNFTYVTISHSDLAWVPDADETTHCRVWYTDLTAFNPFPLLSATFTPATLTPSQSQPPSTVNTFP